MCLIDCGAHIGDGAIPLAHALKYSGREDITVYAIEPCKNKCKFIELMAKLNNLGNIVVINVDYQILNINMKKILIIV